MKETSKSLKLLYKTYPKPNLSIVLDNKRLKRSISPLKQFISPPVNIKKNILIMNMNNRGYKRLNKSFDIRDNRSSTIFRKTDSKKSLLNRTLHLNNTPPLIRNKLISKSCTFKRIPYINPFGSKNKAFNRILRDYVEGKNETEETMQSAIKIHKQFNNSMDSIRNNMGITLYFEKHRLKTHVEYMRIHKPLFIYGSQGKGRYLNKEAIDLIKVGDITMKANSKYKFLYNKLQHYIINTFCN